MADLRGVIGTGPFYHAQLLRERRAPAPGGTDTSSSGSSAVWQEAHSADTVIPTQPFVGLLDLMHPLTGLGQLRLTGTGTYQLIRMMPAELPAVGALDLFGAAVQLHSQQPRRLLQTARGARRRGSPRLTTLMPLTQTLLFGLAQASPLRPVIQQMASPPGPSVHQRHAPATVEQLGTARRLLTEQTFDCPLDSPRLLLALIEGTHGGQSLGFVQTVLLHQFTGQLQVLLSYLAIRLGDASETEEQHLFEIGPQPKTLEQIGPAPQLPVTIQGMPENAAEDSPGHACHQGAQRYSPQRQRPEHIRLPGPVDRPAAGVPASPHPPSTRYAAHR